MLYMRYPIRIGEYSCHFSHNATYWLPGSAWNPKVFQALPDFSGDSKML